MDRFSDLSSLVDYTDTINHVSDQILNNNVCSEYLFKYMLSTDPKYFLDRRYIISLEKFLRAALETSYDVPVFYSKDIQFHQLDNSDRLIDSIMSYIADSLGMLVKLIRIEMTLIDNGLDDLIAVHKALQKIAIYYFSNKATEYYDKYFSVQELTCIEDFVNTYCELGNENIFDECNIGMFTYYLISKCSSINGDHFIKHVDLVINTIKNRNDNKKLHDFKNHLISDNSQISLSINDIDLMTGTQFEQFAAELFSRMGFTPSITKAVGDQGIDIILEKNGEKYGVQAKCYSSSVGNTAIQEVIAGIRYYGLSKGIVITNNYFTKSANELASVSSVVLWDRSILTEKIAELF